ncbi:hypothetical protein PIIN_11498 [Serendipita indica DSM 11827]|uniref:Uncharacterized protein n=1 Tax=Serendipita indica (strain DSM 11827) TaxID=1109443 RepID=G4U1S8_SERID|nr:hypothetical protein PIIN_11498 [Serendipita indica DSM 11827]
MLDHHRKLIGDSLMLSGPDEPHEQAMDKVRKVEEQLRLCYERWVRLNTLWQFQNTIPVQGSKNWVYNVECKLLKEIEAEDDKHRLGNLFSKREGAMSGWDLVLAWIRPTRLHPHHPEELRSEMTVEQQNAHGVCTIFRTSQMEVTSNLNMTHPRVMLLFDTIPKPDFLARSKTLIARMGRAAPPLVVGRTSLPERNLVKAGLGRATLLRMKV